MKKLRQLLVLLAIMLSTWACNISYFEDPSFADDVVTWDPTIAVSLGEIDYTIDQLFESLNDGGAQIGTNENDVVTVIYQQTLQAQDAAEFLQILDQNFSGSAPSNTTIVNAPVATTENVVEVFEYDISVNQGEEYDSLQFSEGSLAMELNSSFDNPVDYTVTIRSLYNGTSVVVESGQLPPNSSQQSQFSIAGYMGYFHLDADGNASRNKLVLEIDYTVSVPQGGNMEPTDAVDFELSILDAEFSQVFGDIGSKTLDTDSHQFELDFFATLGEGDLVFANPKVHLNFTNSFGFPIGVDFNDFVAVDQDGNVVHLEGDVIDDPSLVVGPALQNIGNAETTSVVIDNTNSNIVDLLSIKPQRINVEMGAVSNPSYGPDQYNFIEEASELEVNVDIEIPFNMSFNQVVASELLSFSNADALDNAKRLLLRVMSENDMPIGGSVELQFLDDNENVLYVVDERPAFAGAPVGTDGRTTQSVSSTTDVEIDADAIDKIKESTQIRVLATLTTTNADQGTAVRFFEDYLLNIALAIQADVKLNSSGN